MLCTLAEILITASSMSFAIRAEHGFVDYLVKFFNESVDAISFGKKYGLVYHGKIEGMNNQVHYRRNIGVEDDNLYNCFLSQEKRIYKIEKMRPLQRERRSLFDGNFNDPMFKHQWYYSNKNARDMNIISAWRMGYTGKEIKICILDDAIDYQHPELKRKYLSNLSYDFNDLTNIKKGSNTSYILSSKSSHGTKCAGVAAAEGGNGFCGVGVAYDAFICGHRILDGEITSILEARSIAYMNQHVHIKSISWGPRDDGKTLEGPNRLVYEALRNGALNGRSGLGTIFVWAAGNGGRNNDDCGADGYIGNPYVFPIGSVDYDGTPPAYSEQCSALLAVTYVSNIASKRGLVTSVAGGTCTDEFTGTSAAAPIAAGIFALVLQANRNLTYRQLMHLVVKESKIPNPSSKYEWILNGGGSITSRAYGFGLLDAGRLVNAARNRTYNLPESDKRFIIEEEFDHDKIRYSRREIVATHIIDENEDMKNIQIEHVSVALKLRSNVKRGNLRLKLESPSGTISTLLDFRKNDAVSKEIDYFPFTSLQFWAERVFGKWTFTVQSKTADLNVQSTVIFKIKLILYASTAWDPTQAYLNRNSRILNRTDILQLYKNGRIASILIKSNTSL